MKKNGGGIWEYRFHQSWDLKRYIKKQNPTLCLIKRKGGVVKFERKNKLKTEEDAPTA